MLNTWKSWLQRHHKPQSRHRNSRQQTFKPLEIESLESRELLSATQSPIDGVGNNEIHTDWGAANTQLLRLTTVEYTDGVSSLAGADRHSAREISNTVSTQTESITNDRNLSDYVWQWGQFLDHDIDLTGGATPAEHAPIEVPRGDVSFDPRGDGDKTIDLTRSLYDTNTGDSAGNPRQQINQITSYIDGSVIYGSDQNRANALRTYSRGKLKTSPGDLLPYNSDGYPNASLPHLPADQYYLSGDVRANEQIGLTSLHTLFVREHNRIAVELASQDPWLTDEDIYQQARATVSAYIQKITYSEFLPALLGSGAISAYAGYDAYVNPSIANVFSTAAYRFGHSMVSNEILQLGADGNVIDSGHAALQESFFNPGYLSQKGIEPTLRGLAAQKAQEIDPYVVDGLRNFLFGAPGSGGFDLVSLNIQRGRDHGLPDYNQARIDFGLQPVSHFSEITSDPELQQALEDAYHSVEKVDLWVGGLAEDHVAGSSLGETFQSILVDQFERLRDGDRFWYQNQFSGSQLHAIESTTLADIIIRNTTINEIADNVFYVGGAPTDTGGGDSGGGDSGGGGSDGGGVVNGRPGTSAANAGIIHVGTKVDAAIDSGGEFDYFKFNAVAGGEYAIQTHLDTLTDSFLFLYDTDGVSVLATNDDYQGAKSRIEFKAENTATYYFAVAGYNDYFTGTYSVEVVKTDDHGDHAISATPVSVGSTVDGNIEKPEDDDYFAFVATAGTTYTFETSLGTLPDSVLRLWDTSGDVELASNDDAGGSPASRITWTAAETGTHFLQVYGYGHGYQGTYTLSLAVGATSGGGTGGGDSGGGSGGGSGDSGGSGSGAVVPADAIVISLNSTVDGNIDNHSDIDWYRIELEQGGEYRFSTTLNSLQDSLLYLYGSDRATLIDSNDDFGGPQSRIDFTPQTTGTYYIGVGGFYGTSGTYSLVAIQSDDYGDDALHAFPVSINTSYNGTINETSDLDMFAFQAEGDTTYTIETTLHGLPDSVLILFEADGYSELASNDDASGAASRIVWTAPEDGVYIVAVAPYGAAYVGTYSLWIGDGTVANDGGGSGTGGGSGGSGSGGSGSGGSGGDTGTGTQTTPPADAPALALAEIASGSIDQQGEFEWYRIEVSQGSEYVAYTDLGTLLDSEMSLYAADRTTLLNYNDDSHGAASAIHFTANEPGPVYVGVKGYAQHIGTYTVAVLLTDDYGDNPANAKPVEINTRLDGELSDNTDIDFFSFEARTGTEYKLEVRAKTLLDSVITLYDQNGTVITHNDDSDYGVGSLLHWTAPASGKYFVSVSGYHSYAGTYQFLIGRFNAAPPVKTTLLSPGSTTYDVTPTITWTAVEGATRYDLWVNNLTTGQPQAIRQPVLTVTSYTPDLPLAEGTYRAWVKVFDQYGDDSGWSDGLDFTVIAGTPAMPTLIGPPSETYETRPTLTWDAVEHATHYDLWINNTTTRTSGFIHERSLITNRWTPPEALAEAAYPRLECAWRTRPLESGHQLHHQRAGSGTAHCYRSLGTSRNRQTHDHLGRERTRRHL